jgi:hypothetical protein
MCAGDMLQGRATAVRDKHQIKPQMNQSVLGRELCLFVCTLQFNVGYAEGDLVAMITLRTLK